MKGICTIALPVGVSLYNTAQLLRPCRPGETVCFPQVGPPAPGMACREATKPGPSPQVCCCSVAKFY